MTRTNQPRSPTDRPRSETDVFDFHLPSLHSHRIYDTPAIYDMNFIIRDFEEEALFLTEIYGDHAQNQDSSMKIKVLEFGSGPGRHITTGYGLNILKPGSIGIDSNPKMVEYAKMRSETNTFDVGDMCDYDGKNTFDACWVLLNTLAHATSLDGFLESVSKSLRPGGVCVVEMFSSEDVERFKDGTAEPEDWIVEFDGEEYTSLTKTEELEGHKIQEDDVVTLSSSYGPARPDAYDSKTSMLDIDLEVKVVVNDKRGDVKVDKVFGEGAGKMRVVEVEELAKGCEEYGMELVRDANEGLGGWRELSWENVEEEVGEDLEGIEGEGEGGGEVEGKGEEEGEEQVNDDRWICVLRKKI
ncbi:hypothetical protein TL16_g06034 [Triparma laevis f. inornata]|uniref:Methyltransferase domain-containing protein n=1 Tax=Triparma laevis f. inornata TaxID=1714386 RepID=A0A9W7AS21_9STRA|nr:hypothetical protein TL16_g06034 [Triparma laevis f. inornata]